MTLSPAPSTPLDIYNLPLRDDELLDGISLPSPLPHHLFTLQSMPFTPGRHSPSTESTNSQVLPSLKTTTQDLAEFLRTSSPHDFQPNSPNRASLVRGTYKKALTLLRTRSKTSNFPDDAQLPQNILACTTSHGKRYFQIQVSEPPPPPPPQHLLLTPAPSPPQSLSSLTPSIVSTTDALSPAPWTPSFPPQQPPDANPKPRSYSMEAVGGNILSTPPSQSANSSPTSSPGRRRRTPPRPGPPPARSLPALPETPPAQMTRAQKVRAKKLRDLAAAKESRAQSNEMESNEVEKRLQALERRNEVLENALVAVIRGSVLGQQGVDEKGGLEAFLKELIKVGGV